MFFFAGPGAGKSTTAAWLFSELKTKNYSVELVTEYVKSWATQRREVKEFDQVYLLGKQMNYEYRFLSAGIENIITDSPVLLSASYTKFYFPRLGIHQPLLELAKIYEKEYPSVNIFLNRGDKVYHSQGRYQDRDGALLMDSIIRDDLNSLNLDFKEFDFSNRDSILEYVEEQLRNI